MISKSSLKEGNFVKESSNNMGIYFTNFYPRLAFVSPIFTDTAYTGNGFYYYYNHPYLNASNYLSLKLINEDLLTSYPGLLKNILNTYNYPENRITIISDVILNNNQLYNSNGNRLYDTLVFFHNEYVSLPEYNNMLQFIATGGNVLILDGNAFYAEVAYNNHANNITLISGHGFEFDGNNTNLFSRYGFYGFYSSNNNLKYIGSDDCNFQNGKFSGGTFHVDPLNPHPVSLDMKVSYGLTEVASKYRSAEENCLLTKNADIIVDWKTTAVGYGRGFKMYETFPLGPFGGSLIEMGIYSTNIIYYDKSLQLTFIDLLRHQMGYFASPWIRYPVSGGVYNDNELVIDFTPSLKNEVYLNGSYLGFLPEKTSLGYLPEGTYNLTIIFIEKGTRIARTSFFSIDRTAPNIIFSENNKTVSSFLKNPLTVAIDDKHPEDFSYCIYSSNFLFSNESFPRIGTAHITSSETTFMRNITWNLPNDTFFIEIKAFDSAGNENESEFVFSLNTSIGYTFKPKQATIIQLNETTVKIAINKLNMGMTPYLLVGSKLVIGNNLSNWFKLYFNLFDPVKNEYYLYYTKEDNSSYFLIKLYVNDSTIDKYIPNLRIFYWENNIITVRPFNYRLSILNQNPIVFSISNSYQIPLNGTINLANEDLSNSTKLETFNKYIQSFSLNLTLKNLQPRNYSLYLIIHSKIDLIFTFPFIIASDTPNTNITSIQTNSKESLDTTVTQPSSETTPSFLMISFFSFFFWYLVNQLRKKKYRL